MHNNNYIVKYRATAAAALAVLSLSSLLSQFLLSCLLIKLYRFRFDFYLFTEDLQISA